MTDRFQRLSPTIGARALISREQLLEPAFARECLDALERYGVLVFPEIGISDEQQITFSSALGNIIPQGNLRPDGSRDPIMKVSLDPRETATAEYLKGTIHWHIDGATDSVPARATMLSARRLSPVGGQTEFCNVYAAFESLSEKERDYCETLRIRHSLVAANLLMNPNPTQEELAVWRARGFKVHPAVWRHQSGRKSLVLGATAECMEGMTEADSRATLARLTAHATRRENVYRHEWKVGDLVIWDNCGTMHRVIPYEASSGRMMHRTTLHGVEAIA